MMQLKRFLKKIEPFLVICGFLASIALYAGLALFWKMCKAQ